MPPSFSAMPSGYILGLDLGSHSLGWAILALDDRQQPHGIQATGVRIFEAGKDASRDQILQGLDKQKSRAAARREARLPRRQFWRRARRRYNVLKCLITHGLLPAPTGLDLRQPADQHKYLTYDKDHPDAPIDLQLRRRLRDDVPPQQRHRWEQVWLYELRASALERKLDALELGRAFYHLAQRRGFLSNRKTDAPEDEAGKPKKKRKIEIQSDANPPMPDSSGKDSSDGDKKAEDTKKVKTAIEQLDKDMKAVNADTLGVFFARHIQPEEHRIRGPARWTSRAMYEHEFNKIWEAQKCHYPDILTESFREDLYTAIFFQRPLKPAGHMIGHCDLEPQRKRAPQGIPIARFRMVQKVNDVTVMDPGGREWRLAGAR